MGMDCRTISSLCIEPISLNVPVSHPAVPPFTAWCRGPSPCPRAMPSALVLSSSSLRVLDSGQLSKVAGRGQAKNGVSHTRGLGRGLCFPFSPNMGWEMSSVHLPASSVIKGLGVQVQSGQPPHVSPSQLQRGLCSPRLVPSAVIAAGYVVPA